jgi:diphthine-ammonia ligase
MFQNECEETPLLIVRAKELPRGALIEFQVNLHTGRRDDDGPTVPLSRTDDDDDDEDGDALEAIYTSDESETGIRWEICRTSGIRNRGSRGMIFLTGEFYLYLLDGLGNANRLDDQHVSEDLPAALQTLMNRAVTIRAYHLTTVSASQGKSLLSAFSN